MNAVVAFEEDREILTLKTMTNESATTATYYPWSGEKPPVTGRIFSCSACNKKIQVEFGFGEPDTDYYAPEVHFHSARTKLPGMGRSRQRRSI